MNGKTKSNSVGDYDEIKEIRRALAVMGVSAPESDEELGNQIKSYRRKLIRAVIRFGS